MNRVAPPRLPTARRSATSDGGKCSGTVAPRNVQTCGRAAAAGRTTHAPPPGERTARGGAASGDGTGGAGLAPRRAGTGGGGKPAAGAGSGGTPRTGRSNWPCGPFVGGQLVVPQALA